jgi:hypothetical protein
MGAGSLLASLPVLATFPSGRLLLLPSIGGAVWIGLFIDKGVRSAHEHVPRLLRALGHGFLVLHVLVMPFYWIGVNGTGPVVMALAQPAFTTMELDPERVEDQQVLVFFSPDAYTGFYPMVIREFLELPMPETWQNLSMAPYDHQVTRTGADRFEVQVLGGEMLSTPFERLMRGPQFTLEPGDVVTLPGIQITVLASGAWGPERLEVRVAGSLEDPRYAFMAWQAGQLRDFTWPPVGASVVLRRDGGYFAWKHFKKRLPLL